MIIFWINANASSNWIAMNVLKNFSPSLVFLQLSMTAFQLLDAVAWCYHQQRKVCSAGDYLFRFVNETVK